MRGYKCNAPNCSKSYGSEGALKTHFKQKHQGTKMITKPDGTPSTPSWFASYTYDPEFEPAANDSPPSTTSTPTSSHSPPPTPSSVSPAAGNANSPEKKLVLPETLLSQQLTFHQDGIMLGGNEHKLKYSNVPALMVKIGDYRKTSMFCGDLMARFNYQEKKFDWEIFANSSLMYKIEFKYSDLSGMNIESTPDGTCIITFELAVPPAFFHGYLPQSKSINWIRCADFTLQATVSQYRLHCLCTRYTNAT